MQPIVQTDPAFISSDSEILVANHVYDYLVDIDPNSNVVPRLATDWQVSDDGLTYVFQLAEGVTFHDGSPFTAEDVVWTYDRLRDPSLELPTAEPVQQYHQHRSQRGSGSHLYPRKTKPVLPIRLE